jgi:arsenate reductase
VDRQRVLFLCTGNSARSQMAEAFLRKYGGDRFEACSAGIEPRGLNSLTVKVMAEVGLDPTAYRSKGIEEFLGKLPIQTLITLCDDAEKRCPAVWPGATTRLHWWFEDPAALEGSPAQKLAKFRQVRDQIEHRIQAWLRETAR